VAIVHAAFDLMVVMGSYLAIVALWTLVVMARGSILAEHRPHLWALVVAGPLGFLAIEAGWIVTEVGRQPWTIYGQLRTADAVTPAPGLFVPFVACTVLYCMLGAIVMWLLAHQVLGTSEDVDPAIARPRPSGVLRPAPHDTRRDQ
jgi:cytochrome d ubiquinol oxidase subunit I